MTLSAAAEAAGYGTPKQGCRFGDILSRLNADDLAFYKQMVNDRADYAAIGKVFRKDGHEISDSVIARHHRQVCACR